MNKDLISRLIAVSLWFAAVLLWSFQSWWYLAAVLFIMHFVEVIVVGVKTGRENNRPVSFSIIMTMIFGVTWWGPLRREK